MWSGLGVLLREENADGRDEGLDALAEAAVDLVNAFLELTIGFVYAFAQAAVRFTRFIGEPGDCGIRISNPSAQIINLPLRIPPKLAVFLAVLLSLLGFA